MTNLINIIDEICPEEDPPLFEDENSANECLEICLQLMTEYVEEAPSCITDPDFRELLVEEIKELLFIHLEGVYYYNKYTEEEKECELEELIDYAYDLFFDQVMPSPCVIENNAQDNDILAVKLKRLADKPKHEQRTKEWYEYRYNLITASSAHKAFDSQSAKNQLIYEKCQPLNTEAKNTGSVNVEGPLHWGQKYEPVSVMVYEDMFQTKVADYGCIQHDIYKFLGASPDGIISDPTMPRYGRMLEIKNIVNREITGIPKREYWIQMQLQMETCDLDECDFLETKFTEYQSHSDFCKDGDFLKSAKGEKKGIVMYFSSKDGKPHYVYKPLNMDEGQFDGGWEEEQMHALLVENMTWIKNLYWKLEIISCVLVERNRKWFQDNVHILEELWKTIEAERISGYAHRAPKKRSNSFGDKKMDNYFSPEKGGCLIKKKDIVVIKVRTESIDETKDAINNSV